MTFYAQAGGCCVGRGTWRIICDTLASLVDD
jgi:hypothetical protein